MPSPDPIKLLEGQVEDLQATVRRLENELEELAVTTLVGGGGRSRGTGATHYPDLDTWVREYFATLYARPTGGDLRWCPRWNEHPEAVTRLEAMWRAWEVHRLDPGLGMATWFTTVADPLVAQLLGRSGPFASCFRWAA